MPCIPIDVMMIESDLKELFTPAFVHRLFDKEEWKGRPEIFEAIGNDKNGLLLKRSWFKEENMPSFKIL